MDTNALQEVTLILMTHNRPHYLERALEYYRDMGSYSRIIVADSSSHEHYIANKELINKAQIRFIEHEHTDGAGEEADIAQHFMNGAQKIYRALDRVTTPYVLLAADDDFFVIGAVERSIQFLNKHEDFVCCQGKHVKFILRNYYGKRRFFWRPLLHERLSEAVSSNATERLHYMLERYRDTVYAVYRTDALRIIYQEIKRQPLDVIFVESLHRALVGILGKTKVLDFPYLFRQIADDSNGWLFARDDLLHKDLFNKMSAVNDILSRWLCQYGGVETERANTLASFYTGRFVNWRPDWTTPTQTLPDKSYIKSKIKKLLPTWLISHINHGRTLVNNKLQKRRDRAKLIQDYTKLLKKCPVEFKKIEKAVIYSRIVTPCNQALWDEM